MLRFFASRRSVQFLVSFLCMVALAIGLFYSAPAAHATSRSSNPHIIWGPPIQCLDVSLSSIWNQRTVYIQNPPGGAVRYDQELRVNVDAPCPTNYSVSQIKVYSQANITCPGSSVSPNPPPLVFYGPYPLSRGGGYGQSYESTDYCVVYQNGIPVSAFVPTRISRTFWAIGLLIEGQGRQNVTSNTITLNVWPV